MSNNDGVQTAIDPQSMVLGIANMHDMAAKRAQHPVAKLTHEQAAMHLRAVADDADALRRIASGETWPLEMEAQNG